MVPVAGTYTPVAALALPRRAAIAVLVVVWTGAALLVGGGACDTAGAVIFARQSPDPRPATFGYHEVFHVLVLVGAALHFFAIRFVVLPQA